MNKKSLVMMLVTICLVGVIGVGATFAYLTDTTEQVTNTFTLGKVDIEIDEPHWDGDPTDIVPGQSFDKDPTVTVVANSVDSYVFMSVEGVDEMQAEGFVIDGINAAWEKADGLTTVDGIYVYKDVVAKADVDKALEPLFAKVTYSADNTENNGGEFKILVKAAAVQATGDNAYTYETAYAQVADGLVDFE